MEKVKSQKKRDVPPSFTSRTITSVYRTHMSKHVPAIKKWLCIRGAFYLPGRIRSKINTARSSLTIGHIICLTQVTEQFS